MFESPFSANNQNNEWKNHSRSLPWVCGLKTYNSGPTVYACLESASATFNQIVITDDGSKDETLEEIKRFCKNYPNTSVLFFDVSEWDPIPDLKVKRDHGSGKQVKAHPTNKSHTKAQIKNWLSCKKNFPESIYFSLEDDVMLYPEIRKRVQERIESWSEPLTDCEYFNLTNLVNRERVRVGLSSAGMNRRTLYENAGDWTFSCFYMGGKTTVGPDPVNPWGACTLPWSQKNQCEKKGQDGTKPFGLHMYYYRRSRQDFLLEDGLKRAKIIQALNDDTVDIDFIKGLNFKIDIEIDENGKMTVRDL